MIGRVRRASLCDEMSMLNEMSILRGKEKMADHRQTANTDFIVAVQAGECKQRGACSVQVWGCSLLAACSLRTRVLSVADNAALRDVVCCKTRRSRGRAAIERRPHCLEGDSGCEWAVCARPGRRAGPLKQPRRVWCSSPPCSPAQHRAGGGGRGAARKTEPRAYLDSPARPSESAGCCRWHPSRRHCAARRAQARSPPPQPAHSQRRLPRYTEKHTHRYKKHTHSGLRIRLPGSDWCV